MHTNVDHIDTGIINWVEADLVTHTVPTVRDNRYQMTFPETENAVSFIGMKCSNLAYGGMIVAIMTLAVFAGGANTFHHNAETVEQSSTALSQETDEKAEIEV